MSKVTIPEGTYLYSGGKFEVEGVRYFIKERKMTSPKKPKQYLFALAPNFEYISSLYPVEQKKEVDRYQIDYQKEVYLLDIEAGKVEIQQVKI